MSDHCGRNIAFLDISQNFNVNEQPVGDNYQRLNPPVEQHLQIALKPAALVMDVSENWQIRRFVKRALNPAQYRNAIGIRHVKDHDTDCVGAPVSQSPSEYVGAIT